MSSLEKNPNDFLTNLRNNCDEIISNYEIPFANAMLFSYIAGTRLKTNNAHRTSGGGFFGALAGAVLGGIACSKSNGKVPDDIFNEIEKPEENLDIYNDILAFCHKKNIDEVELYTKAFVSKTVFSKIRSMKTTGYKPSKSTIVCLCLALNLNILETQALLNKAGYILSNEIFTDKIISYCIEKSFFNIYEIESLLSEKVNRPVLFKA